MISGRGDRGSIEDRRGSLRDLGLLKGIRRGPFLVPADADNGYGDGSTTYALHCATISEALHEEWAENHKNDNIRASVMGGFNAVIGHDTGRMANGGYVHISQRSDDRGDRFGCHEGEL